MTAAAGGGAHAAVTPPSGFRGVAPVDLAVRGLSVAYPRGAGWVRAVDGVSLRVRQGERVGILGESGCGKSSLLRSILRLLPDGVRVDGEILLDGRDILSLPAEELRRVRWTKIALVTQSAMNALDPVYRVGAQIEEAIRAHMEVSRSVARHRAEELFELVGIAPNRLRDYPHQLSGGMRQRAVIAMAISLNPSLLLADEPTTALDVITQDQILDQLRALQDELGLSMVLVTHDLSVILETCESLAVMYAGRIVERGSTSDVFVHPQHPYTMGLRNALPKLGDRSSVPVSIPGRPPDLVDPPRGCRFAPRCPFSTRQCEEVDPPLVELEPGHLAACHYADRAPEMRAAAADPARWSTAGDTAAAEGTA